MSMMALSWAFDQTVTGNDKLVLLALADNADADGSCFPSHAVLAKKASVSERTVQTVLNRLRDADLLHWERRNSSATGYRSSNRYYLHIAALQTANSAGWPNGNSEPPNGNFGEPNGNLLQFEGNPQIEPSVKNHGDDGFDEFWSLWPRKVAKLNAQKAWAKATKKVSSGVILPAVLAYAKSVRGKDQQYIAHPATWLNGERWNDFTQSAAPTPKRRDPFDVEPAGWQVAAREAGML